MLVMEDRSFIQQGFLSEGMEHRHDQNSDKFIKQVDFGYLLAIYSSGVASAIQSMPAASM